MGYLGGPGSFFILLAFVFALYAQNKVQSSYTRYARVQNSRGLTGAETARTLLRQQGLYDVEVESIPGRLTDHYDPRAKRVRLSQEIFSGTSVAALSIAAHETGHALQHNQGYAALSLRNSILPVARIGSSLAFPLFLAGMVLSWPGLSDIGILFFVAALLFQVITLPVEFDASRRALALLGDGGFLSPQEMRPARSVLQAAALTYVAAVATALAQLMRLLLLRRSRD